MALDSTVSPIPTGIPAGETEPPAAIEPPSADPSASPETAPIAAGAARSPDDPMRVRLIIHFSCRQSAIGRHVGELTQTILNGFDHLAPSFELRCETPSAP